MQPSVQVCISGNGKMLRPSIIPTALRNPLALRSFQDWPWLPLEGRCCGYSHFMEGRNEAKREKLKRKGRDLPWRRVKEQD